MDLNLVQTIDEVETPDGREKKIFVDEKPILN